MRLVVTFLALLVGAGCTHAQPISNAYSKIAAPVGDRCLQGGKDGTCALYAVSLTELVSVPDKFHGKQVQVIGYVSLEFEGNAVCPSKDTVNSRECLFLDVDGLRDPGFRKGYAIVEGRFDGESRGHLGCCSGALEQITRLQRWR
jgi:hypothetical protein